MQPFETAALAAFLVSYLIIAVRAIATPGRYRTAEINFYKTGKPGRGEITVFAMGALALPLAILHLVFELPRTGEVVLYGQILLFEISLPFHFLPSFRKNMVRTLGRKTDDDYRRSGRLKLYIAAGMIALPLVLRF